MSWTDKVIWSEGMYLSPQHFQQHDRYLLRTMEQRTGRLCAFPWGVWVVKADDTLLEDGKFALKECRGILPDGTPINVPEEDESPQAIEVPEAVKTSIVYLGVPLQRAGSSEVARASDSQSQSRWWYDPDSPLQVKDSNADAYLDEPEPVDVGRLRLKLILVESKRSDGHGDDHLQPEDARAGYSCLAIARIVDRDANRQVVLDQDYMPPALSCQSVDSLREYINSVLKLLDKRAESLTEELGEIGRGGASELYNFMLLQLVNRYRPLFSHWKDLKRGLHPIDLYECILQLAGELATFRSDVRLASAFGPYRHENLNGCFGPVMDAIRAALIEIPERPAQEIPIIEDKHGYFYAEVRDSNLLREASFVLEVRAELPAKRLRDIFPEQLTIAAPQEISRIVRGQKRGIEVTPMDKQLPPQIPFHKGVCYFELDPSSSHWRGLADAGGIALHLTGQFPGLTMSFWAILE